MPSNEHRNRGRPRHRVPDKIHHFWATATVADAVESGPPV
jgi:hypothetical protein